MRSLADVQRAHDMLISMQEHAYLLPKNADVEAEFLAEQIQEAMASTLCWVLQDDHYWDRNSVLNNMIDIADSILGT